MILGCGEWGLRELGMEDHLKFCKKLGFHYLEIGIGPSVKGHLRENISDREISEFHALKEEYDIETPYCVLANDFTLKDKSEHQKQVEQTTNLLHLVKKLGAKYVRLFTGFTVVDDITEDIWQRMISAIKECDQICQKIGLEIGLETHGKVIVSKDNIFYHKHTSSTNRDCLKRLVKEIPETVGICYDPGNMRAVEPGDDRYGLDIINDKINYCHLKDWRPKGDGWYPGAPGDHELDYQNLFPKIKYKGVYIIEYEATEDYEDGYLRTINYLKSIGQTIEFR